MSTMCHQSTVSEGEMTATDGGPSPARHPRCARASCRRARTDPTRGSDHLGVARLIDLGPRDLHRDLAALPVQRRADSHQGHRDRRAGGRRSPPDRRHVTRALRPPHPSGLLRGAAEHRAEHRPRHRRPVGLGGRRTTDRRPPDRAAHRRPGRLLLPLGRTVSLPCGDHQAGLGTLSGHSRHRLRGG